MIEIAQLPSYELNATPEPPPDEVELELVAMRKVYEAVRGLDKDAIDRIMEWVSERVSNG